VEAVTAERDAAVRALGERRVAAEGLAAAINDSQAELVRRRAGDTGDPRTHLRHVVHPQDPAEIRRSRVLDVWSAVSVAFAVVLLGVLLIFNVSWWWIGVLVIVAGYVAIEALVRRRFLALLLDVTIVLAVIGALIVVGAYLPEFIAVALLAVGVVILRDNVRELRQSRG
jgi:membrane-bound ClpP family serine protease